MELSTKLKPHPDHSNQGVIRLHRHSQPEFWHKLEANPYATPDSKKAGQAKESSPFPIRLDRILTARRRSGPDTILIGGPSDPYPSAEKRNRSTRLALEVVAKHGHPIQLVTGSTLILRDIDILREINEAHSSTVAFTLPSLSASKLRQLQPRTSKLSERLDALERICRSGLQTGMAIWPHHPGQNDRPKDFVAIFRIAKEIGLDFLLFPFADGYFYRKWWDGDEQPKLARTRLNRTLLELSTEYRIRLRPKRYIPRDRRSENYWLAGRLADEAYRLHMLGQPFRAHLSAARTLNNMRYDVRNLIKMGGMSALPDLPASSLPDVERLLQGTWADDFDPLV